MSNLRPAWAPADDPSSVPDWRRMVDALPLGVILLEGDSLLVRYVNAAGRQWVGAVPGSTFAQALAQAGGLSSLAPAILDQVSHWMGGRNSGVANWRVIDPVAGCLAVTVRWRPLGGGPDGPRQGMLVFGDSRDPDAPRDHPPVYEFLLRHDALTGLDNRTALLERLSGMIARTPAESFALLKLDLDDFKRINDSLGHAAGDVVLVTVAERLRASCGDDDVVVRSGADEFIVLLRGVGERAIADNRARTLVTRISEPLSAAGVSIGLSASVGIVIWPADGQTLERLLRSMDQALYAAKRASGRGSRRFSGADTASESLASLVLERELAEAIEAHQFELYFQPQLRVADGSLAGVEALVRWRHPTRGLLFPDTFIPLAEKLHLTLPMGDWIIGEALRRASGWRAEGLLAAPIAVNLSNHQMHWDGLLVSLERHFKGRPEQTSWLEMEITEGTLLDDLAQVRYRLARLNEMGFSVSVDDFGTGFFSPRHLRSLPIDKVKIDRSFISELHQGKEPMALARAIILMAGCLGKEVTAEGVETALQRDFLVDCGCHILQGNRISPPLPADAFTAWLVQFAASEGVTGL